MLSIYKVTSFEKAFWCNETESLPDYYHNENTSSAQCNLQIFNTTANNSVIFPCKAWVYENTFHRTIVQEWDLVCDRSWYIKFGELVFYIGCLLAFLPSGHLADMYGRRPIGIIGMGAFFTSFFATIVTTSTTTFMFNRFLIGISFGIGLNPILCIYLESVGPRYRDLLVLCFSGFWGLGRTLDVVIAYYWLPEWRAQALLGAMVFVFPLGLMIYGLAGESARWLIAFKKYEKAKKVIIKQAKRNSKCLGNPERVIELLKLENEPDLAKGHLTFFDLFRNQILRKRAALVYFLFYVAMFVNQEYFESIQDLGELHFMIGAVGIADLLAVLPYLLLVNYCDRRRSLLLCFIVCGIELLLVLAVPDSMIWLKICLAITARILGSAGITLLYVFTTELFPTNLRLAALGGSMTTGTIGGILSHFNHSMVVKPFPSIHCGILALIVSFLFLILPSTKRNQYLNDTVIQSERVASPPGETETQVLTQCAIIESFESDVQSQNESL